MATGLTEAGGRESCDSVAASASEWASFDTFQLDRKGDYPTPIRPWDRGRLARIEFQKGYKRNAASEWGECGRDARGPREATFPNVTFPRSRHPR